MAVGDGVNVGVGEGVCVGGIGVGEGVAVGGDDVAVGEDVGVGDGTAVGGSGVGVRVDVGAGVGVAVAVGTGEGVAVGGGVSVGVAVGGTAVSVGSGLPACALFLPRIAVGVGGAGVDVGCSVGVEVSGRAGVGGGSVGLTGAPLNDGVTVGGGVSVGTGAGVVMPGGSEAFPGGCPGVDVSSGKGVGNGLPSKVTGVGCMPGVGEVRKMSGSGPEHAVASSTARLAASPGQLRRTVYLKAVIRFSPSPCTTDCSSPVTLHLATAVSLRPRYR